MRLIKTIKDIEILKDASVVKEEILVEVEEHFKHICSNLGEGIPIDQFSLVHTGIIVILESGDNVTDLGEIGLNSEDNGLLGATPEWIKEQVIEEGILVTTCILYNNEYAVSIFFERGKLGEDIENWINDNI